MNDSDEQKKAFALELLKTPNEPFKAALAVFPTDTGLAVWVATKWINDPIVVQARDEILSKHDEMDFLPGKVDLCRAIWDKMNPKEGGYVGIDDFTKLAKLYADVRGFIAKPDQNMSFNFVNNKVMEVRDLGSNDDWEAKAERQQRDLVNVAQSRH